MMELQVCTLVCEACVYNETVTELCVGGSNEDTLSSRIDKCIVSCILYLIILHFYLLPVIIGILILAGESYYYYYLLLFY